MFFVARSTSIRIKLTFIALIYYHKYYMVQDNTKELCIYYYLLTVRGRDNRQCHRNKKLTKQVSDTLAMTTLALLCYNLILPIINPACIL
jgi:hypothetical protein